jgi:glutaredoxin
MRTLVLVVAVFAAVYLWQNYGRQPDVVDNHAEYFAGLDQDVIMYATTWCPYCRKMRTWFSNNNIRYFEYDIEKSDEGRRQFEALGGRGVPLVLVRNRLIKGYNPAAVKQALAAPAE